MRAIILAVLLASAASCGELTSEAVSPASASPTPATSGTGDCVALAGVAPVLVPQLEVADVGNGTRRVTSAEGGYTLEVPGEWLISGSWSGGEPAFAQAHMTSYDPRVVPPARPEAGGILPPEVGIRFDIELWANPRSRAPDVYASEVRIGPDQVGVLPGSFTELGGTRAYRFTLQDERRFQPADGALISTRQTRAVWLVPSPRADRMLVLYATPAESALLSQVEHALSTLRVTMPVRSVLPVSKQRSANRERWLIGKAGPIAGRRVETKLMTYAEAGIALRGPGDPALTPTGVLRIDRDLDELFWLVAVSGPDLPQGRGGPRSAGTPPPTTWILYTEPATEARRSGGTGAAYSSRGTWPPNFDALPDRCR